MTEDGDGGGRRSARYDTRDTHRKVGVALGRATAPHGSGGGLVRAPIEPSGRSTAREGRWIFKVGPERERDIGALDDGPDTGARAFGPCGLSAGVTGGWSDEEELRSQVGTGTESPFGPT